DPHAAAAGRHEVVPVGLGTDLGEDGLEPVDELESAPVRYVAPVEEDVHAYLRDPLLVAASQHGHELVDVAVHVSAREQADEVHGLPAPLHPLDGGAPPLATPDRSILEGALHELRALIEDTTGPHR